MLAKKGDRMRKKFSNVIHTKHSDGLSFSKMEKCGNNHVILEIQLFFLLPFVISKEGMKKSLKLFFMCLHAEKVLENFVIAFFYGTSSNKICPILMKYFFNKVDELLCCCERKLTLVSSSLIMLHFVMC